MNWIGDKLRQFSVVLIIFETEWLQIENWVETRQNSVHTTFQDRTELQKTKHVQFQNCLPPTVLTCPCPRCELGITDAWDKCCVALQVNFSADQVLPGFFHVQLVMQPAEVTSAWPATWRLHAETCPANIQVSASTTGWHTCCVPLSWAGWAIHISWPSAVSVCVCMLTRVAQIVTAAHRDL